MPGSATRTVVYDRWFMAELQRGERIRGQGRFTKGRHAIARPVIDKRDPDPRIALVVAAKARGQSLAALSRMLGRPDRYLDRFVRDGVPKALTANEHSILSAFFGVDERGLGVRQLWMPQ